MLWIRTANGKRFFPFAPNTCGVDVEDIAQALSLLCCFSGQTPVFYSLAQHCIQVSRLLAPHLSIHGMLLRADAAYLGSTPTIVRSGCPDFFARSRDIRSCIYHALKIYLPNPQDELTVEVARDTVMSTEARDILGIENDAAQTVGALTTILVPMSHAEARETWLLELEEARRTYEP